MFQKALYFWADQTHFFVLKKCPWSTCGAFPWCFPPLLAVCQTQVEGKMYFWTAEWRNEKERLHYNQSYSIILFINMVTVMIKSIMRGTLTQWISRLSDQLQLRSWSHSWWIQAPCQALCWQLRAWSLLWVLCLPFYRRLSYSRYVSLSLSLSKINKHF